MKLLPLLLLLFAYCSSYSQQEEKFQIEGQVIGINGKPVADAYIINFRDSDKNITNSNGIFSFWVLPGDSLLISHISYYRKVVTVHTLLTNPIVQIQLDTVNIKDVVVSPNQKTDYEKAMENIESIKWDFRPQPDDKYTESERVELLFNTENIVHRSAASSVNFLKFSPSEKIQNFFKKRKQRKNSRQYKSMRKRK
ncbi:MAG: carboxypeptidase regulatory-like domain-containing protein [Bacteroidetes bacterium]|nr:carboxypeptidase regulatory-like domain-containing protein [Bacteroidota bacterium]